MPEKKMRAMIESLKKAIESYNKAYPSSFESYSALEKFRKIANTNNIAFLIKYIEENIKDEL